MSGFHGPYGYDPATALSSLTTPSLWILGENDRSIPRRRTVDVLTRLSHAKPKAFTIDVIPGVNHRLMAAHTRRRAQLVRSWVASAFRKKFWFVASVSRRKISS